MADETRRPAESPGGAFRVGSEAPVSPRDARCDSPWPGPWEDRVQRRPRCAGPVRHDGPHVVEEAGVDGRCLRYVWGEKVVERVEPC